MLEEPGILFDIAWNCDTWPRGDSGVKGITNPDQKERNAYV